MVWNRTLIMKRRHNRHGLESNPFTSPIISSVRGSVCGAVGEVGIATKSGRTAIGFGFEPSFLLYGEASVAQSVRLESQLVGGTTANWAGGYLNYTSDWCLSRMQISEPGRSFNKIEM